MYSIKKMKNLTIKDKQKFNHSLECIEKYINEIRMLNIDVNKQEIKGYLKSIEYHYYRLNLIIKNALK